MWIEDVRYDDDAGYLVYEMEIASLYSATILKMSAKRLETRN